MPSYSDNICVISGSAHPVLSEAVARAMDIPLCNAHIGRFPDGEIDIKINDDVRGADCFVLQPLAPPVNENWVELLLLLDCLKRASAGRVTAVMPYYGYARKDRKDEGRVPISAKVVANTITRCGADRVLTIDMHAHQIQGFYDIPVDHLYAKPVLLKAVREMNIVKPVVVTPDVGGIKMARAYAKALEADLAIVDKRRTAPNVAEVMHIIGEVEERNVLILDDIIDTAGTLTKTVEALRAKGARRILAAGVHGVLSGPAMERIDKSPLELVLVTNTTPVDDKLQRSSKLRALSVAPLLGEAIRRIHENSSVSSLFV